MFFLLKMLLFHRLYRPTICIGRGQQALFALVDALTKTFLTCAGAAIRVHIPGCRKSEAALRASHAE